MSEPLSVETLAAEAMGILSRIYDNGREGRSNKLSEVKGSFEAGGALEFDDYFFFLRKFHYIAMDREAQLKLTGTGTRLAEGEDADTLIGQITEFFAEQLAQGNATAIGAAPLEPTPPPVVSPLLAPQRVEPPAPAKPRKPQDDAGEGRATAFVPPPPPAQPFQLPTALPSAQPPAGAKGQDFDLRYTRGEQLGVGPLGTVFRAKQNALGVEVCIKELKDIFGFFSFLQRADVVRRLKKELCAQAVVSHPNVLRIVDQNTDVARPYFVMELAASSLQQRMALSGGKGLSPPDAIRLFLQMCYGLRAAHATGLTHHNLKPDNVLLDVHGNARLADFGLTRVIEVDAAKGLPHVFVGTSGMSYMSPELLQKSREAGPSADIYALGLILYEMLTGNLPGRRSPLPHEVKPDCPEGIDAIFDRMTQDRREARYPDLDAVLDDFYSAFKDGSYLARGDLILQSGP